MTKKRYHDTLSYAERGKALLPDTIHPFFYNDTLGSTCNPHDHIPFSKREPPIPQADGRLPNITDDYSDHHEKDERLWTRKDYRKDR